MTTKVKQTLVCLYKENTLPLTLITSSAFKEEKCDFSLLFKWIVFAIKSVVCMYLFLSMNRGSWLKVTSNISFMRYHSIDYFVVL